MKSNKISSICSGMFLVAVNDSQKLSEVTFRVVANLIKMAPGQRAKYYSCSGNMCGMQRMMMMMIKFVHFISSGNSVI